jgi:hypothetical protein
MPFYGSELEVARLVRTPPGFRVVALLLLEGSQMPDGQSFNALTEGPDSQFAIDPEPRWTQDL